MLDAFIILILFIINIVLVFSFFLVIIIILDFLTNGTISDRIKAILENKLKKKGQNE